MKEFIAVIALGLAHYPLIATAQSQSAETSSASRADDIDYLNSVCHPDVGSDSSVLPPCISVENIETDCKPKGKTPADYAAAAECICKKPSSYFEDWLGCRKCLEVHGGFSELQYNAYVLQASAASQSYCQGTPTGYIDSAFAAAKVDGTPTGNTAVSDKFPSQTAVSLYYKPSGSQEPGVMESAGGKDTAAGFPTGSVTGMVTADSGSGSQTTGAAGASGSTKATGSASPSSSSKSAAQANAPLTKFASLGLIGFVAVLIAL